MLVSLNGQICDCSDALVNGTSVAALYGKGIFTTIAIRNSEPLFWEKHWKRLQTNAVKLGIDLSEFPESTVLDDLNAIVSKTGIAEGRARVTFIDESPSSIWPYATDRQTSLLIMTAEPRAVPESIRLTISPHRVNTTSPLAGVKSCNYLEHLVAYGEARGRGFDEAIRLNERGEIASACMANVFWLKGNKLFTPSLKTGCLAGTTREFVLENLACMEREDGVGALSNADAIYLTSAGLGVVRANEIDGRALGGADHPILTRIYLRMNEDERR